VVDVEPGFGSLRVVWVASSAACQGKIARKGDKTAHLSHSLGPKKREHIQRRKIRYRRCRRGCYNSWFITTGPLTDVYPKIRFSQNRKAALKQRLLGVVASEGKRFPSIFAAPGDKINAAAHKELYRRKMVTWL
jgi:hypothetical protein